MSRRHRIFHKHVKRDARYANPLIARLINAVMRCGKKSVAEYIVYSAIDKSREGIDVIDPLEIFNRALDNIKPRLEVKSRRMGGATYQVPIEVTPERQVTLAIRWIVSLASKRKGMSMIKALTYELKDAAAGQGNAIKKRDDMHKMAQANRAFAHFRW